MIAPRMIQKRAIVRFWPVVVLILLLGSSTLASAQGDGNNQAGVVVQFSDGRLFTRCVEFSEPSISGYDLLDRAGLAIVAEFSGVGAAVCKVDGDGCDFPADPCFCQCQGTPCLYWVYHHLIDGAWQYSGFGASSYQLHDGDVDGWAWGEGSPTGGVQPPLIPFDQICAPTPTETPLPSPTPTTMPVPTSTPMPTATPTLANTPEPVVWFRLDQNPIDAGACTMLRWDTGGLRELYLDGEPVAPIGEAEVCPTTAQSYALRVVTGGYEEQIHTLDLGVAGAFPPTAFPSTTPSVGAPASTPFSSTVLPLPTGTPPPETQDATLIPPQPDDVGRTPTSPPPPAGPTAVAELVVIAAPPLPTPTGTPTVVAAVTPEESEAPDPSEPEPLDLGSGNELQGYLVFGALATCLSVVLLVMRARR